MNGNIIIIKSSNRNRISSNLNGVSLIALVVTIIIILIIAGGIIFSPFGDNGIISESKNAKIKNELYKYKEEFEYYIACKKIEDLDFKKNTLNAGINSLSYNTKTDDEEGNIKTVITTLSNKYIDMLEIIKGELTLHTKDKNLIEIAKLVGIEPNPYDIVDGVLLSSTGNLLLMDQSGTLTIPNSVTTIGEGAFANLDGLKTIIIPGTCKEIAVNAFSYNSSLENVIMQDGVEIIGPSAFSNCKNLKEVQMADSVKTLGAQAFLYCNSLQSIDLSSGITVLASNVFSGCSSLKELIIPNGVTRLEGSCFANLTITEIDIPSSVNYINNSAFINCFELTNINFENNDYYFFSDGVLSNKAGTSIVFMTKSKLTESNVFAIPEGITSFSYALQTYTNIKN